LQDPSKFTQIGTFGLKLCHLATLTQSMQFVAYYRPPSGPSNRVTRIGLLCDCLLLVIFLKIPEVVQIFVLLCTTITVTYYFCQTWFGLQFWRLFHKRIWSPCPAMKRTAWCSRVHTKNRCSTKSLCSAQLGTPNILDPSTAAAKHS
jgi:hypothetical protein